MSEKNSSSPLADNMLQLVGPRENVIETAVSFLRNPRVMQSEVSHKTYFLKKKGLTDEEIDIALKRALSVIKNTNAELMQVSYPAPVSFWPKLQAFSSTTVVIGTSLYLLYRFYKNYILPFLLGVPQEEDRITVLEKTIRSLESSIQGLDSLFSSLNQKLDSCCAAINSIQSTENSQNISFEFDNLKRDISSLKGLLLNRKQFPPAPTINPIIPSWQREQPPSPNEDNTETDPIEIQHTGLKENTASKLEAIGAADRSEMTNKNSDSNSSDNGSYVCVNEIEGS